MKGSFSTRWNASASSGLASNAAIFMSPHSHAIPKHTKRARLQLETDS